MSNTKLQAVDDIRKLGRSLRGLLAFADELERIGSVENAAKESDARLAQAQKLEEAAGKDLAVALQDLEKTKAQASRILADARTLADRHVEIGKAAAQDAIAKAQKDADGLVAGAKARHAEIEAGTKRLEGYAEDLKREISEKSAIVADLDKKLAGIRKQLGG